MASVTTSRGAEQGAGGKPLAGKVAVVTGASRGIGAAIAQRLAADGAAVVVHYSSSEAAALKVVEQIVAAGGKAKAVRANLAQRGKAEELLKGAEQAFGPRIDILVNNAGVYVVGPISELKPEDYDKVFDTNVRAVFEVTRLSVPRLADGGRVINVGSVVGERSLAPGHSIYAASKFAVAGLSRGWGPVRHLAPRQITVNTVQPGPIDTDMNPADAAVNPAADGMRQMIPLGRYGHADEVAAAVAFLATPQAAFITGSEITVDGGAIA